MMTKNRYLTVAFGLLAIMAASAVTIADNSEAGYSGFLGGDEVYERLEKVEVRDGREVYRWIGPKLSFANYKSVLVDDVVTT